MSRPPQKKASKLVATSGVRVKRYFPGKAPEVELDDLSASENENDDKSTPAHQPDTGPADSPHSSTASAPIRAVADQQSAVPLSQHTHSDSSSDVSESESDEESKRLLAARLRARQRAEEEASSSSGSDSENDSESRRMQMESRQRSRQNEQTKTASPSPASSDNGDSDSVKSSSESDDSSSDDEDEDEAGLAPRLLFKPVFVPKSQRQTNQQLDRPGDSETTRTTAAELQSQRLEQRERSVRIAAEEARRAREQPE
ncbi:hypothetical protein LPJ57_008243, partial [Coemansia sp. RSA 486]